MGKTVRKSLNGRNLQQMTRVTKGLCLYKNSDPKGLSAPAPGLHTCIKTWKIMYKIRLQRYFSETCNKWAKWQGFSVDSRILSTTGCLAPALGLYTCGKTLKNVYKIRIQRDLIETLQQMVTVIRAFCWHQKFVPKGFSALAPGLYTCIKSLKMCIKSDFEEISLKLATYEQREKAFLLSSKLCSKWIVCPCQGPEFSLGFWK